MSKGTVGSNPTLSASLTQDSATLPRGEMAERLKAHAWKACVSKGTVGSNPTLSASTWLVVAWLSQHATRCAIGLLQDWRVLGRGTRGA